MTHVIHRNLRTEVPTAVGGDGPYIIDQKGKRYLDASGGAAVSCLGHSDREVSAAISAQLERIPYAHTGFFTTEPAEELADFLSSKAPANLGNCYFVSGGSEAIEIGDEDRPAIFRGARRKGTPSHHREAPILSRQHARGARRRRQHVAAPAISAAADRDASHLALLRISRPARRTRARRNMARASPTSSSRRSRSSARHR